MTQLNSNFNAPFHVVVKDQSDVIGVVASTATQADADEIAANRRALLDATGNENTDVYTVAGQPGLAAFVEEHNGIPTEFQTDNSGTREVQRVEALTQTPAEAAPAEDAPKKSNAAKSADK